MSKKHRGQKDKWQNKRKRQQVENLGHSSNRTKTDEARIHHQKKHRQKKAKEKLQGGAK